MYKIYRRGAWVQTLYHRTNPLHVRYSGLGSVLLKDILTPPPLPRTLGAGETPRANMYAATNMNSKIANYWVHPRE